MEEVAPKRLKWDVNSLTYIIFQEESLSKTERSNILVV